MNRGRTPEERRRRARRSLLAWKLACVPVGFLSVMAAREAFAEGTPWAALLIVAVAVVSMWTGVDTAQAQLNADLPTEGDE